MIYKDFQDLKLSALGMGTMRLPVLDGNDQVCPQTIKIPEELKKFAAKMGR